MVIIVESYARGTFAENIAKWINNCEQTLGFVYFYQPSILTVLDALQGNHSMKICDPYGHLAERK